MYWKNNFLFLIKIKRYFILFNYYIINLLFYLIKERITLGYFVKNTKYHLQKVL